jgi:cytochrome c556
MKGLLLAALAAAARRRDARAALGVFHEMQSACNACHAEFRRPLLEKLYGL